MFKLKRCEVFKVKIVYKSGATHEFDAYEFKVVRGTFHWTPCSDQNKPILIGVDDIAAIYQTGYRKVWRLVKGE